MTVFIVVSYFLAFARVQIIENDNGNYRHLFSLRDNQNRDILLHWEGKSKLGDEDTRVWLHIHEMECSRVNTIDEIDTGGSLYQASSRTWLCTAQLVQGDR